MKPKIAFFDFASCEGCQLAILNLEDALLDLLERVDIVEFREALSEKAPRYDVAFVEGSVHREEDADRLRDIRARAKTLVALGACACNGNVQARSNATAPAVNLARVYGEEARDRVQTDPEHWPLWAHTRVRPIQDVVQVDYYLRGCPVVPAEFAKLLTALIVGSEPRFAREPVCTECKRAGNACVFGRSETCLGQVTWAGCGAVCVTQGYRCDGCRGLLPGANIEAHRQILREAGLDDVTINDRYDLFCSSQRKPERPRGILFHDYTFGDDGRCVAANAVIPTSQNIANIEADMRAFAPAMVKDLSREALTLHMEMLLRAYDPCISCSVHMLDVTFVE